MSDTAGAYLAEAPVATAVLEYSFEQLTPAEPVSRDALSELVAQAEAQAAEIRARAREEGYAEGHVAGHSDGLVAASSVAQTLAEALTGVIALREEVSVAVERDAIELAVALAEKILSGALEAKPELVGEVARGALRRIGENRRVTLLVNPADVEAVAAALGSGGVGEEGSGGAGERADGVTAEGDSRARADQGLLRARPREGMPWDIHADPRVPPGGAIAQTDEGEVDASVHTQLERARELMLTQP